MKFKLTHPFVGNRMSGGKDRRERDPAVCLSEPFPSLSWLWNSEYYPDAARSMQQHFSLQTQIVFPVYYDLATLLFYPTSKQGSTQPLWLPGNTSRRIEKLQAAIKQWWPSWFIPRLRAAEEASTSFSSFRTVQIWVRQSHQDQETSPHLKETKGDFSGSKYQKPHGSDGIQTVPSRIKMNIQGPERRISEVAAVPEHCCPLFLAPVCSFLGCRGMKVPSISFAPWLTVKQLNG